VRHVEIKEKSKMISHIAPTDMLVGRYNNSNSFTTVQSAVRMPSALAATDQWPCRWCSAWTQPRQKLTASTSQYMKTVFVPALNSVESRVAIDGYCNLLKVPDS